MRYVYILRSEKVFAQRYTGITSDLKKRLKYHNEGRSIHTSKYRPWRIETYIAFIDEKKAVEFEKYLKTGSGWAFSLKRF